MARPPTTLLLGAGFVVAIVVIAAVAMMMQGNNDSAQGPTPGPSSPALPLEISALSDGYGVSPPGSTQLEVTAPPPPPPPDASKICGDLITRTNMQPHVSWGSMNEDDKKSFYTHGCEGGPLCAFLEKKHNVTSQSWGDMPYRLRKGYRGMNCSPRPPTDRADVCGELITRTGMLPHLTWGQMNEAEKEVFYSNQCEAGPLCEFMSFAYGASPGNKGSMTDQMAQSYERMRCT